ncbi:RNA polymerase subunit sigma-70 [Mesorhizobium sp. 1M-11]|uniref:RNA polymerase subunit sigma-70 n=1 Tax=Mesorhizobium sp. 1M-11 TaxID=1529006 RepID=UPI0006C7494B|nr:RNA polymerase subunit sigma-70 [Mesorhizobium sp. 1M-11]
MSQHAARQAAVKKPANPAESEWLRQARAGDASAFDQLMKPYRKPLHTHCYRMLGSPFDADDALQETLLAAWRGLGSFEARSSLATWLNSIATRICLRMISKRPRRLTSGDLAAPLRSTAELGEPVPGPVWMEPMPESELAASEDPAAILLRREHIGLAFVALLQHLPGMQRAVLLLREVLGYSAAETADILGTTVASANSALQRSRQTMRAKTPATVQSGEMPHVDAQGLEPLLHSFVSAWESRDLTAMVNLLAEDVRFTMPPLPAWFSGRAFVGKFFAERVFETPWRLQPLRGNGQPGFACYLKQAGDDRFRPGGVVLLSIANGHITAIDSFLDPAVCRRFGMHDEVQ